MAPKRPSPLDEPPAASSSEVEETSSGEEEEGVSRDGSSSEEEEDDEETQAQTPKPKKSSASPSTPAVEKKSAPKKPEVAATNSQAQSSSSESDSESDSHTDTEPGRNVKPISSKPMEETPKVKKPRSKPSASATPARSSLKRPSETTRDAKRPKKSSEADAEDGVVAEHDSKKSVDESKKLFQRLWSEEDEIVILNGIIDYSSKKGTDPSMDMNAFHDFIKKSLHVDFTRNQLMDKIRRLRKKYRNNADRGKKGADPTFSKLHEQKGFELSKKIWGGEGIARTPIVEQQKPNANDTPKKIQRGSTSKPPVSLKSELLPCALKEDDKMKVDDHEAPSGCMDGFVAFERSLGAVGLPESFLKPGLELIGQSKKTELEEEWKKLHLAELELFLKRTELIRDQAKLILEAYNKSSDKVPLRWRLRLLPVSCCGRNIISNCEQAVYEAHNPPIDKR